MVETSTVNLSQSIVIVSSDHERLILRLPDGLCLPEGNLIARREGDHLIIEHADRKSLLEALNEMSPLIAEDGLPDVKNGLPLLRDVDL